LEQPFSRKADAKYQVQAGTGQIEINCDYFYDLQEDFPSVAN